MGIFCFRGGKINLVIYYDMNCVINCKIVGLRYVKCFLYDILISNSRIIVNGNR